MNEIEKQSQTQWPQLGHNLSIQDYLSTFRDGDVLYNLQIRRYECT